MELRKRVVANRPRSATPSHKQFGTLARAINAELRTQRRDAATAAAEAAAVTATPAGSAGGSQLLPQAGGLLLQVRALAGQWC